MKIIDEPSPNYSKRKRSKSDIKLVIIHYTGMQSEIESLNRLKDINSKVSCHYFINRKGDILRLVDDNKVAWHAGKSKWKKFNNLNNCSIGIELANCGHDFGYQAFPKKQIKSLIMLGTFLKSKYKIKTENFLGHSDISPIRKKDPGEKFPWKKLSQFKLGKWYNKDVNKKNENKIEKTQNLFFKNIFKIGYRYFYLTKRSKSDSSVIRAFQRRYLPKNVTGKLDKKTLKISELLLKN